MKAELRDMIDDMIRNESIAASVEYGRAASLVNNERKRIEQTHPEAGSRELKQLLTCTAAYTRYRVAANRSYRVAVMLNEWNDYIYGGEGDGGK